MTVHSYETSTGTCIGKSPIPSNINDPVTSENASNACVHMYLRRGGVQKFYLIGHYLHLYKSSLVFRGFLNDI